ncbi:T7SS effector LXG polymorphic toxin (plasmid) [Niallia taxi]|uniref:T7SS effector LXG polymorphic toxin n=1 Tax=Niallia taxi TaxID=2499688 RepID=UPI0029350664|nr:T7SS effector LXG polymorphic toxin [Niallia taxi]WOD65684.1 T7SS effector LXG polymorphic toxin [Niallia taxi]
MKVLDSASLRDTMKERKQHYKELGTQFSQLKQDFQTIVDLDDFEGNGAKAIKGFYQGQIEVVEAWQRLIDRQISFFEGVSGKLDDKDLGGDTRVESAFLEEDLAQKERQADEMITEQRNSLEHIFRDIDDLVPLELYSRSQFDDLMMNANSMRTKTITAVEETDKELKEEYMSSEGEESYVIQLFGALLSATSKGKSISPIHFDADAYNTSDIYKQIGEAEAATLSYLTYKKEEQEARELENRPAVEKVWDGVKSFVGEFTGYYDYKRAVNGIDPVTGEKMSAIQRAASAGWAIAGFLPIVGWAGRAVKGGKGIYAATKGISAAEQAMSTYKNVHAFTALEKTEMGIYGLLSANGLSEYVTGKDMIGNELTEQQRQASLAQSVFAGLPFVPSMAREASKLGYQAVNSTVQFGKQGADITRSVIDDLGQKINIGPNVSFAGGIGNLNTYLKSEGKVDVRKVSADKEDNLSGMKSADDKGTSKYSQITEVTGENFGKHIIKGKNGRKELAPNVRYITEENYKYTTDEIGRIVDVNAAELILGKGKRNTAMQVAVGREDRLFDDDGGHLIGTQFRGSGDIDNLLAQNKHINRSGGEWYKMETEWANALKEIPPKKVSVKIKPVFVETSLRPDSYKVTYEIEGKGIFRKTIENRAGG